MGAQIIIETKVFYFWILIVTDISLIGTKHVMHDLKTSHWASCIWNWNRNKCISNVQLFSSSSYYELLLLSQLYLQSKFFDNY